MGLSDSYMTVPEYRALAVKTSAADDITLARELQGISRVIDDVCGQFFTKDDEVAARTFKAKWSDRLDLDYEGNCPGICDTTGLLIKVDTDNDGSFADETAWAVTDYELWPMQANKGPEPRPYDRIIIPSRSSKHFVPNSLVQVTAIYGWAHVPAMVTELCGLWGKVWRLEGPEGTGQINELGQVFSISLDVKRLCDRVIDAYSSKKVTF